MRAAIAGTPRCSAISWAWRPRAARLSTTSRGPSADRRPEPPRPRSAAPDEEPSGVAEADRDAARRVSGRAAGGGGVARAGRALPRAVTRRRRRVGDARDVVRRRHARVLHELRGGAP